jgi:DNA-binding beta-propeller fold protein YncE
VTARAVCFLLPSMLAFVVAGCGEPVAILGDTPGAMRIVAGVADASGESVETLATESRIADPTGLAIGTDGMLFVAEAVNARVISVASNGTLGVVRADRFCSGDCLESPADAALDPLGRLIVADRADHRIWRFDPGTGTAEILAGTGALGITPDGAPAAGSPLNRPTGVAVDADGVIYFAELGAHRVRFIDATGALRTLVGTGTPGFSGDGGASTEAEIDTPRGLDIAAGILYLADSGNNRIRAVSLDDGTITTVAGTGLRGFGGDGGAAVAAALNSPEDVAATSDGRRIFIADTGNHRVRHVPFESGLIETFAGTGDDEFTGNLLDAGATSVASPSGLATGPFGFLFISDPGHDVVWRVVLGF